MKAVKMSEKIILFALFSALSLNATSAWAQGEGDGATEEASEQDAAFDEAISAANERYEADDLDGAIDAFKKAYAIKNESDILYNIGRLYEKKGDFKNAVDYYGRYANEPDIKPEFRRDALERRKGLREVLDMREEETKPKEEPIETPKEETEPTDTTTPGDDVTDTVVTEKPSRALPVTFLVLGGAALAGGATFGVLADGSHKEAQESTDLAVVRAANERGQRQALTADALFVTGGVMAGLGVVFLITSRSKTSDTALITPILSPRAAGVGMTWTF